MEQVGVLFFCEVELLLDSESRHSPKISGRPGSIVLRGYFCFIQLLELKIKVFLNFLKAFRKVAGCLAFFESKLVVISGIVGHDAC